MLSHSVCAIAVHPFVITVLTAHVQSAVICRKIMDHPHTVHGPSINLTDLYFMDEKHRFQLLRKLTLVPWPTKAIANAR